MTSPPKSLSCRRASAYRPPAPTGSHIEVTVALPPEFPDKLVEPLRRVIDHCTVHNSLREPPVVTTQIAGEIEDQEVA